MLILAQKRRVYARVFSLIRIILPSEKNSHAGGNVLKLEMPASLHQGAFGYRNNLRILARSGELSPEIYPLSGLVIGLILNRDSTTSVMHKILLAEDDNDMRRFLVKALENAGFQVSPHDNGMSAYQRLREEPFEMLLTDIVMPEMDGIELARRASELDPDIKIMFITGFAAVALNSDSEAPKNAKVLSKPVHLRELVSEVNKMLAA
jgi:two-component system cell cycle response regulator CpdR